MYEILPQLLVNGLFVGSLYSLAGAGFVLDYRVNGAFNFCHAGYIAAGAYVCWFVSLGLRGRLGLESQPLVLCLSAGIGLLASAALAALLEHSIFRRLRSRGSNALILLLTSIGLFTVLQNAISLTAGEDSKVLRPPGAAGAHVLTLPGLGGARISVTQAGIIGLMAVVGLGVVCLLQRTAWGKQVRALANDSELAVIVGLPANRLRLGVQALAGALAGLAGICVALDTELSPLMGFRIIVMVSAAMVVGGLGDLRGAVVGGLLLGLLQSLALLILDTRWQDTLAFLLLISCLVLRPQGLLGNARKSLKHLPMEG